MIKDRSVAPDAAIARTKLAAISAGTGVKTYVESGNIDAQYTPVSTPSSTDENTLMSFSMPANTLSANGQQLESFAFGSYALDNNGKTIRAYLGTQKIVDSGALAANGGTWNLWIFIFRSASGAQAIFAQFQQGNTTIASAATVGAQVDTAAIVLKVTGQPTTTSPNQITQTAMKTTFFG